MTTHGHTRYVDGKRALTAEYRVWCHIRIRCGIVEGRELPDYVERGMYEDWKHNFESFYTYLTESIGLHPGGDYSIERINNDIGYFPGNLRWATRKEQALNRKIRSDNVSGYRGVSKQQYGYISRIVIDSGNRKYLGFFSDPKDAAIAYDNAARLYHGNNARLNFPNPNEQGVK
jgi:hypothetical protein